MEGQSTGSTGNHTQDRAHGQAEDQWVSSLGQEKGLVNKTLLFPLCSQAARRKDPVTSEEPQRKFLTHANVKSFYGSSLSFKLNLVSGVYIPYSKTYFHTCSH